jgi:hypothetical protein
MSSPLLAIVGAVVVVNQVKDLIGSLYPPLAIKYNKTALSTWPVQIPTITELTEMKFKEQLTDIQFFDYCKQNGFSNEFALKYLAVANTMLSASDYIALWRRAEIDRSVLDTKLKQLHIDDNTQEEIIKATEYYPNPEDIVRFAVREVFTPATAEKFGQYEDMPDKFIEEAGKVGLTKEKATWYWAAHWGLPSAEQGFAMFQRGIIDKPTLDMLLRALDIMPYWRDALTLLAYNPITRVDIRRMYGMGLLTYEEVQRAYQDGGYSPENAMRLADFTVMDAIDEKSSLTRAAVDKQFKDDFITEQEYVDFYKQLGYTVDSINTSLSFARHDKFMDAATIKVNELTAQYKKGLVSLTDISSQLMALSVPATWVRKQLSKIELSIADKVQLPTKDDMVKWLAGGSITVAQFTDKMRRSGYLQEDIQLYLDANGLQAG